MKITTAKKDAIIDKIVKVMSALDVTGYNAERERKRLSAMSLDEMGKWLESFKKNEDENFYLDVQPFHNEPNLEQIEKAAKVTGTKLHQYVYFRHDGMDGDGNPIRTKKRVPVGLTA